MSYSSESKDTLYVLTEQQIRNKENNYLIQEAYLSKPTYAPKARQKKLTIGAASLLNLGKER